MRPCSPDRRVFLVPEKNVDEAVTLTLTLPLTLTPTLESTQPLILIVDPDSIFQWVF